MAELNPFDLPHMQELQTTEQKKLFDAIDSLRSYGLGNFTSLPQMVVCGGQSTGKSSVLEAISGVPFPRNVGLCTRFATEVILRRDSATEIKVSLTPAYDRTPEDGERLRAFKHELISYEDLPTLIVKAQEAMDYSTTRSGMTFSQDVLRIEISGPKQPQLSIVDLPGIIQAGTDNITEEDIILVEKLVMSYILKPRSIILAIITASTDPENQVVLRKAREVDPEGLRTLGIITKPDTLAKGTPGEEKWLALARNGRSKLKLGWHVVKNVDLNALASGSNIQKDRDAEEAAFFKDSRFKADTGRKLGVGIASLRERLSKILFNQIQDTIHPLLNDIEAGLSRCQQELAKLGEARSSLDKQRAYLVRISQRFSDLCRESIYGHYKDHFFNETEQHTRLCARLREAHDLFATKLIDTGLNWRLSESGEPRNSFAHGVAITTAKRLLRENRGTELPGLQNSEIIHQLFLEHSKQWESLAREHIRDCRIMIQRFLIEAMKTLASEDVCERLLDDWINPHMGLKVQEAHSELEKLISVHKQPPMTMSRSFWKTVYRIQGETNRNSIVEEINEKFNGIKEVSKDEIRLAVSEWKPRDEVGDVETLNAKKALAITQAYYEHAANIFMDNVPTLSIWATMVNDLPQIFSPQTVIEIGDVAVGKIASESPHIVTQREELETRLAMLKRGREECELQISKSNFTNNQTPAKSWNFSGSFADPPSKNWFQPAHATNNGTASDPFLTRLSGSAKIVTKSTTNSSGTSLFGSPNTAKTTNPTPPNGGLFGGAKLASTAASTTSSGSLFGSANTASTAAPTTSNGTLFGGSSTTKTADPIPPSIGLFGSASITNTAAPPTFGARLLANPKTKTVVVNLPAPSTSLFGGTNNTNTATSNAPQTSLFANINQSNESPGPSLFSNIPATTTTTTTTTARSKPNGGSEWQK